MRIGFVLLLSCVSASLSAEERLSLGFRPISFLAQVESLEEARKLADDEFDVGYTALLVAKLAQPKLKAERYLSMLDQMAKAVLRRLKTDSTPTEAVSAISRYLFRVRGFRYHSGPADGVDPHNAYLNKALDGRKGFCLSLSVLYLALAERMNLQLRLVEAPKHVFVRYQSKTLRFNIETTAGGTRVADAAYRKKYKVPVQARNYYLRSRKPRMAVAYLLMSHASILYRSGKAAQARKTYLRARSWDPENLLVSYNLANSELRARRYQPALALYERYLSRHPRDASGWLGKARCLMRLGQRSESEVAVRQAARLDSNNLEIRLIRAELALQAKDYARVHALVRGPLSRQMAGRYLKGRAYLAEEKFELAQPIFRGLVTQYPREIDFKRKLGTAIYGRKQRVEAATIFDQALRSHPTDLYCLAMLSTIHRELGELGKARAYLLRYKQAGGRDQSILAGLRGR